MFLQDIGMLVNTHSPWTIVNTSLGSQLVQTKNITDSKGHYRGQLILANTLRPVFDILEGVEKRANLRASLETSDGTTVFPLLKTTDRSLADKMQKAFPIPLSPWNMVLTADRQELLKPLRRILVITVFFCVASAFLVAGTIFFHIRRLLKPIQYLKKAVDRFGQGEIVPRVEITQSDEIGSLSQSFYDMSDALQKKQEEVERSGLILRTTLDASLDAIIGLDSQFNVVTWNRATEQLFQLEGTSLLGKTLATFLPLEAATSLLQKANQESIVNHFETEATTRLGSHRILHLTMAGAVEAKDRQTWWTLVLRDMTEEKALQEQLIQAEKLSAVGQLVSGVAHEINNPLTAVIGFSELLTKAEKLPWDKVKIDIDYIFQNALRCRDIVANLLRFVRKSKLQKKKMDANQAVQGVLKLMEYRLMRKEFIQVDTQLDGTLPPVNADSQQIEQVLLNLLQNACDAMSDQKRPKRLCIRTSLAQDNIRIDIEDNGPGIPKPIQDKIFEPFFTTKVEGKGTGLGLAISRRIIADHHGSMTVSSTQNVGTQFSVFLPVSPITITAPEIAPQDPPAIPSKRLLVVDDEKDVLTFMHQALLTDHHVVTSARNGKEALEQLQKNSFDGVICDIELGDIKGDQLPLLIKKETTSHVPTFLFVTGDILPPNIIEQFKQKKIPLLQKPFSAQELCFKVRLCLQN